MGFSKVANSETTEQKPNISIQQKLYKWILHQTNYL